MGDHDFCLSRSHYTDTDPTSRERAATAGIEPGTSSPGVARSTTELPRPQKKKKKKKKKKEEEKEEEVVEEEEEKITGRRRDSPISFVISSYLILYILNIIMITKSDDVQVFQ